MFRIVLIDEYNYDLKESAEKLLKEVLWDSIGIDVKNRKEFFEENENIKELTFIALDEDENLAGCLVIVPVGNSSLEIKHLAVKKDCQMKGIGKLLVKTALNNFKTNKFKVIVRNTSIPFWEKMGFNSYGEWMYHPDFNKYGIKFREYSLRNNDI